jgi:hypothetical protein
MKNLIGTFLSFGCFLWVSQSALADIGTYVPGSAEKICQLTGDIDREFQKPTLNQTETNDGIVGTDLGFSFEHHGKLYFLFGDTTERTGLNRTLNEDVISYAKSSDLNVDGCIRLNVIKDPSDGGFHPPKLPGISNATFEVPAGGVSANDKMYVYFTNGTSDTKLMHRSYLGVSEDDGYTFTKKYLFSNLDFINVTPVKVASATYPELPTKTSSSILLFGSGWYRKSNPYLSVVDESAIDQKSSIRYFSGIDRATQKPKWSQVETDSAPLFEHPCLGEFSVVFDEHLHKWIMLYNCDIAKDRGINMRLADKPWGPWSASQVIYNPVREGSYGKFMHQSYTDLKDKVDDLSDLGQEDQWGGEYGPYLIPSRFTTDGDEETLVYTLSIHNPYQVILMKSKVKLK